MRGFGKFLSGFILGGLLGAALALLFTPVGGADLRSQMQTEVERIQTEVQQAAQARRAELEQQLAELRAPRKD